MATVRRAVKGLLQLGLAIGCVLVVGTAAAAGLAPTVSTGAATAVTATSATLTGTVNPNGQSTTYYFDYGTTTAYGQTAPAPPASAGSGASNVNASVPVSSLTPNTTYHYRLVATNASGTTMGTDHSFKTMAAPGPPTVTTGGVKSVASTSATLTGTVNPNGQATTYEFEYGPSTAYGHTAPAAPVAAGSGSTNVNASVPVSSLTPNTTYHYRLVASNASGTVDGADHTFKTKAGAKPPPTKPGSPTVTTGGVKAVTANSASLTGTVNPNGHATTYYFEYGTTTHYGQRAPASPLSAGSGNKTVNVSVTAAPLSPNTTYHYRLVASGASGTVTGADRTFKTLVPSSITITASPSSITFGQTTNISGSLVSHGVKTATVTLQSSASPRGPFVSIATTTTNAKGSYTFPSRALSANTYLRALADGATSSPILVQVRFRISFLISSTHPKRGQRIRFHGSVAPGHNGMRVQIQRLGADGRWHTVARPRLRAAGANTSTYSIRLLAHRGRYRVLAGPDARHAQGHSRALRVRVH